MEWKHCVLRIYSVNGSVFSIVGEEMGMNSIQEIKNLVAEI